MNLAHQGMLEEFKGRLREVWGSLTDDDLMKAEGQHDQLVGAIMRRTGEEQETVQTRIDSIYETMPPFIR